MSGEPRYCICCGEEVPANTITRHGRIELTCAYCGFLLETLAQKQEPPPNKEIEPVQEPVGVEGSHPDPEPASVHEDQKPRASQRPRISSQVGVKTAQPLRPEGPSASDCIITSDDAELTRGILKAALLKKKLTQTVLSTENGQEFIKVFTKRLAEKQPVNLVILDLEMPVMNGIMAARVMRAVEQKVGGTPVPILFFSARKCDEELRKQLSLFSPTVYINKGNDTDPAKLMERIDLLVGYLLQKRESTAA